MILSKQSNYLKNVLIVNVILITISGLIKNLPIEAIMLYILGIALPSILYIFDTNCLTGLYNFLNGKNVIKSSGQLCHTWSWVRTVFAIFPMLIFTLFIIILIFSNNNTQDNTPSEPVLNDNRLSLSPSSDEQNN